MAEIHLKAGERAHLLSSGAIVVAPYGSMLDRVLMLRFLRPRRKR